MKKWIIGLLVLCLAVVVVIALSGDQLFAKPAQLPEETPQVIDALQTPAPRRARRKRRLRSLPPRSLPRRKRPWITRPSMPSMSRMRSS